MKVIHCISQNVALFVSLLLNLFVQTGFKREGKFPIQYMINKTMFYFQRRSVFFIIISRAGGLIQLINWPVLV